MSRQMVPHDQRTGSEREVIRMSTRLRGLVVALIVGFDAMTIWLLVFSLTKLAGGPNIGLAVFIALVALAMTWLLWRLYRSRIIITADDVVLKYALFPRVRILRADITGVDMRPVTRYLLGGGLTYTPFLTTSDGRDHPVYLSGRRFENAARRQVTQLRRALGM